MPKYSVVVPIAGHATIEVEAADEAAAIAKAVDEVSAEHLDSWESIERFHEGNVCYCPRPWEAEAEEITAE